MSILDLYSQLNDTEKIEVYNQILPVYCEVVDKLNRIKYLEELEVEITKNKFAIRYDPPHLEGYKSFSIKLNLNLKTWAVDEAFEILSISETQDENVIALGIKWYPEFVTPYNVISNQDWEYGNPFYGTGYINLTVLYKQQKIPDGNFKLINENGVFENNRDLPGLIL